MRTVNRLSAILVWSLSASAVFAAFLLPDYSRAQLQDKQFLRDEIVRLSTVREELLRQNENATVLVQMTLKRDLQKVDSVLEALRYVESVGFREDDPQLAKLSYFQSSRKPFEAGLQHNMTPAGPRGGRVSILDGKPQSRPPGTRTQAPRRPAPQPAYRPPAPPRRPPNK